MESAGGWALETNNGWFQVFFYKKYVFKVFVKKNARTGKNKMDRSLQKIQ